MLSLTQGIVFRQGVSRFFLKHSFSADHSFTLCLPDIPLLLYVHLSHEAREVSAFYFRVPEMLWSAGGFLCLHSVL